MYRSKQEWEELLNKMGLLWIHDGNPLRPHAILTSELHSNGFFNAGKLFFDHPKLAREFCADFVEQIRPMMQTIPTPYRVIGPAFGALTFAENIATELDVAMGLSVPQGEGKGKKFELEKRFRDCKGKHVLAVEDVITTGGSVSGNIAAVEEIGGFVLPIIFAACNRSGMEYINGRKIFAMIEKHMPTFENEAVCQYCQVGSKPLRNVKEPANWTLLNATY